MIDNHGKNDGGWGPQPIKFMPPKSIDGGPFFYRLAWWMAVITALLYLAAHLEDWLHSIF
jgi:hypothetical protein